MFGHFLNVYFPFWWFLTEDFAPTKFINLKWRWWSIILFCSFLDKINCQTHHSNVSIDAAVDWTQRHICFSSIKIWLCRMNMKWYDDSFTDNFFFVIEVSLNRFLFLRWTETRFLSIWSNFVFFFVFERVFWKTQRIENCNVWIHLNRNTNLQCSFEGEWFFEWYLNSLQSFSQFALFPIFSQEIFGSV